MGSENQENTIPETLVTSKIYVIRGRKIMLDKDLAELKEDETRVLNQAVTRNLEFVFSYLNELTEK